MQTRGQPQELNGLEDRAQVSLCSGPAGLVPVLVCGAHKFGRHSMGLGDLELGVSKVCLKPESGQIWDSIERTSPTFSAPNRVHPFGPPALPARIWSPARRSRPRTTMPELVCGRLFVCASLASQRQGAPPFGGRLAEVWPKRHLQILAYSAVQSQRAGRKFKCRPNGPQTLRTGRRRRSTRSLLWAKWVQSGGAETGRL